MEWNVYYYNQNNNKFEIFNVFRHSAFAHDINRVLKLGLDLAVAKEEIRKVLFYYFWAKCEWEIEISDWIGGDARIKVDVYHQVMMNFDRFCEYVLRGVKMTISKNREEKYDEIR